MTVPLEIEHCRLSFSFTSAHFSGYFLFFFQISFNFCIFLSYKQLFNICNALLWSFNNEKLVGVLYVMHFHKKTEYLSHWDHFFSLCPSLCWWSFCLISSWRLSPFFKEMAPESNLNRIFLKEPGKTSLWAKQQHTFGEPDAFFHFLKIVILGSARPVYLSYIVGKMCIQRQTCLKNWTFSFLLITDADLLPSRDKDCKELKITEKPLESLPATLKPAW